MNAHTHTRTHIHTGSHTLHSSSSGMVLPQMISVAPSLSERQIPPSNGHSTPSKKATRTQPAHLLRWSVLLHLLQWDKNHHQTDTPLRSVHPVQESQKDPINQLRRSATTDHHDHDLKQSSRGEAVLLKQVSKNGTLRPHKAITLNRDRERGGGVGDGGWGWGFW